MEMKMCLVVACTVLMLVTVPAQTRNGLIVGTGHAFLSGASQSVVLECVEDTAGVSPSGGYKWRKDGTDLTGTAFKSTTVRFTADQASAGEYKCEPPGLGESGVWKISLETPQKPKVACEAVEVDKTSKCACISGNHAEIKVEGFELAVNGKATTAEGTNTPKNEVSVKLTSDLVGKSVTCKAKFGQNEVSPEGSTKLVATCSGCVKVASVSLMTIGLVLLLGTVLMKE